MQRQRALARIDLNPSTSLFILFIQHGQDLVAPNTTHAGPTWPSPGSETHGSRATETRGRLSESTTAMRDFGGSVSLRLLRIVTVTIKMYANRSSCASTRGKTSLVYWTGQLMADWGAREMKLFSTSRQRSGRKVFPRGVAPKLRQYADGQEIVA